MFSSCSVLINNLHIQLSQVKSIGRLITLNSIFKFVSDYRVLAERYLPDNEKQDVELGGEQGFWSCKLVHFFQVNVSINWNSKFTSS